MIRRLFSFQGRVTRTEFWTTWGSGILVLAFLGGLSQGKAIPKPVAGIAACLVLIPMAAVQAKRWHDLGMSGWWILINAVPGFGPLFSIVMLGLVHGTRGANDYGQDSRI